MDCKRKSLESKGLAKCKFTAILFVVAFLSVACRMTVSLTGGDIDPRAKTVYVQTFINNATLVNPTLSQDFTTALKDMIQRQTPLTIINTNNGDYAFEGRITGYSIAPVAIQGDETAAMNRLTITVTVKFTNKFDESKNFEQSFSRYADYASSMNFTSVESTLVNEINEALTDDIFNKSFVNW
ncbi:MAG: LPS assembly lipoprotein LptE [Bacteroidales bacterium]|nr:LPS assembly lipoprotein LptE [Bacteroidales bacterium]